MFQSKMQLSSNYLLNIYVDLISLAPTIIGIAVALALIQVSINAYTAVQGALVDNSNTMVNSIIGVITEEKAFEY
ncbi:hypothetical protein Metho_2486 (plasmid) [Methanomethylovorans hollandica DSM 15978]|jgi:hypothetical protein|uniref:Uncharacterized protein n=1 Tax=Methanomethylovorans hollandica (strain DSM 15978 / NBRC 107637 / DMS1) TaxID=867904 RepID=L0KZT7_METHD|nr:hypothetical protein [Methanomethylovorans hollandica]AGB50626.1 hypothetical protein Metho_2486 [Methanomethylovorans hollandica DSM 15978]